MPVRTLLCVAFICLGLFAQPQVNADSALQASQALYAKGDYAGAKASAERALALFETADGPESAGVARALNAMGAAANVAGDYAGAIPIYMRSLSVARKVFGPEARETVEIEESVASNFLRAGQHAKAKTMEEDALAICEKRFGPDDALMAHALQVLAQILTEMGDYPSASKYQLRSLAILQAKDGPDAVTVGDALDTLGNAANDSAQYARAADYFARAAAIYEKRLGPHNTRLGGALDNLGQALTSLKRIPEARRALERALAIQTQELGATHPWTGNVLQSMAKLEAAAGNYANARDLYQQNLAIWRERLGPTHPFTVVSMTLLSDVLAHLGDYSAALDTALDAARIRREDILLTVRTVDEREALRYAERHTASMDTALSIAARPEASALDRAKVWNALIQSRALVLDEMSARQRTVQQSKDPAVAQLAKDVAGARSQITRLVLQGPGKATLPEYTATLEGSRAQLAQTEDALAVQSAEFRRQLEQHHTGYEQVRKALPEGSGLVAFRRYRRQIYGAGSNAGSESYMALVLAGPDRQPAVVNLGGAAHIEQLVKAWRAEIDRERTSLGRAGQSNEASYRAAATALRIAVWDPVVRRMGGMRRVFIVPDGALQLVNFAALPTAAGEYLVEKGPLLHLLAAERDLAAAASTAPGADLLVVADPAFDARPQSSGTAYRGSQAGCGDFAAQKFRALPGSLTEMQAIRQIWASRGGHSVALSGVRATETAVKDGVAGKRVIHFATHGFFLDAECRGTAVARENPLLRAGLVLAGANLRKDAGPGDDDGILTAEEAASMDLSGTEWVVLSGCDTGLGDIKTGEGVLGLRRAFQEAGARTVINSLWPVEDQAARQWMAALYRARLVDGRATAESIRSADLTELRARRQKGQSTHPFYWAGFVAVGDWR